jgi:bacterioferritin-associated ferredoxin
MKTAEIKKQWLLQNEMICLCKAIPRKRFTAAIKSGATSVEEINKIVGSGAGDCKGERCHPVIKQLINDFLKSIGKKQASSPPQNNAPPDKQ